MEDLKAINFAGERKLTNHHAFLLTKSVPRTSNGSKWKGNSGNAPYMLDDRDIDAGKLLVDLVFWNDALVCRKTLIVQEVLLDNTSEHIVV